MHMRRTNDKSASVLNEVDATLRTLDYQLFTAEQNQRLYSNPEDWAPGESLLGLPGNHVRPMVEMVDERPIPPRCVKCDVSWNPRESGWICWSCGDDCEPPVVEVVYKHPQIHFSRRAEHQLILDDQIAVFTAAATDWFRNYNESLRELGRLLNAAANGAQGFRAVFDETTHFAGPVGVWPVNRQRAPIAPDTDVFRRTTKPIELVPPVAADLSVPVEGSVHIPEDVDLSGRVVPEVALPESGPIVIPSGGWHELSITQQRRRRD